jgi:chromate reductase
MPTKITAFGGSLRRGALNTALLLAAADLAPAEADVTIADIRRLPLYNPDVDEAMGGGPEPAPASAFRDLVAEADGLMIVTPEYNWSIPGFLKNAIDWVSRPAGASPLAGKPTLLMGASGGPAGTGRAQLHLRQILLSTRTPVLLESLELPFGNDHFDDEGQLDRESAERVEELMGSLVAEAARVSSEVGAGRLA